MESVVFKLGEKDILFTLGDTLKSLYLFNRNISPYQPTGISFYPADVIKEKEVIAAVTTIPKDPKDPYKGQKVIEALNQKHMTWLKCQLCFSETPCPLRVRRPRFCGGITVGNLFRGPGLVSRTTGEAKLAALFDTFTDMLLTQDFGNLLTALGAHCYNIK